MFVHQSQLRHLLSPRDYFAPDVHEREVERLFRPGWHFLVTTAELRRHGDFRTLDLLGTPLLVRNIDGQIHAFLNSCAHRHCQIRSEPAGHDPNFRCQYHGWEYNADGSTGKIPDARCFRPWDRENARLVKFRTAQLGEMVFVSLLAEGPTLEEQLGSFHEQARTWLAPPFRLAYTWDREYAANWKAVTENSLESYHIPCLHQKSFGIVPPEDTCEHDLAEGHTTFRTPEIHGWISKIQNMLVRSLGLPVTNIYTHHHAHPNLIFISLDVMRMVQLMVPTSPTTTRHRVWVYTPIGTRRNPWAWLVRKALSPTVVHVARKVLSEDAPIFAHLQRGLEASPFRGVIGTREERVYYFQQYVQKALGREEANGRAALPVLA